jgi:hypothetical protein
VIVYGKVENDLLYCETMIADESELIEALSLTKRFIIRNRYFSFDDYAFV